MLMIMNTFKLVVKHIIICLLKIELIGHAIDQHYGDLFQHSSNLAFHITTEKVN